MTEDSLKKLIEILDPSKAKEFENNTMSVKEAAFDTAAFLFAFPPHKDTSMINAFRKQMRYFYEHGVFKTKEELE